MSQAWWLVSWLAAIVALFSITTVGIIMAANAGLVNDIQDLKLLVLKNNITFLDMLEQVISTNITNWFIRINIAYDTLLDIGATQVTLINDLQTILVNITTLNASIIDINNQIVNITTELTVIETELTFIEENIEPALQANISSLHVALDNATAPLLFTINGVFPQSNNVNITGSDGLSAYGGSQAGIINVDACLIQDNIFAVSTDIDSTMMQLFMEIMLSNTVLGTLNGQFPILGNLVLEGGGDGVAITPGPASNEVRATVTGNVLTLQGQAGPAIAITAEAPLVVTPFPASSLLQLTTTQTCLGPTSLIAANQGVTASSSGNDLFLKSTFAPNQLQPLLSPFCHVRYINTVQTITVPPTNAFVDFFTPTTPGFNTRTYTTVKDCAYNNPGGQYLVFAGETGVFEFTVTIELFNLATVSHAASGAFTQRGVWGFYYCFGPLGPNCATGAQPQPGCVSTSLEAAGFISFKVDAGPAYGTFVYTYTFTQVWKTAVHPSVFGMGFKVLQATGPGTPGFDPANNGRWTVDISVQKLQ